MARNYDDQSLIRRYLLNQLTGEAQRQIEQRLLTGDGFFEELEIAEDELIDGYLSEKLSEDERERFEQYFLATPERQQKVRFSRSFSRYINAPQGPKETQPATSAFWSINHRALAAAATVAVIVIVAGILFFSRQRTPPTFATYTLIPSNTTRGEDQQKKTRVKLPLNVEVLRLRLELPVTADPATTYRVVLLDEHRQQQTLSPVGQDSRSVTAEIAAAQLSLGQYALKVYVVRSDRTEQPLTDSYFLTVE